MTWNKVEADIIKEHGKTLKSIEKALVGDIETKEPGLIDDIGYLKRMINKLKTAMEKNRKQHIALFTLVGICLGILFLDMFGIKLDANIFLQFASNVIKAIF